MEAVEEGIVKFSFEWWVSFAAIWGGVLATLHVVVAGFKAWVNRPRIYITTNLTGSPEVGNQIAIYSHSPIPINIHGYEIYRKKKWFGKKKNINSSFEDGELINLKIEAHSTKILNFRDQNHFSWSLNTKEEHGALHIKSYIDGRCFAVIKKIRDVAYV